MGFWHSADGRRFANIVPKLYFRGLRGLKEKGIFTVEAWSIFDSLILIWIKSLRLPKPQSGCERKEA